MDLIVNDKFACWSKAQRGGDGSETSVKGKQWATINSMSWCEGPIKVKKGDEMSMTAL